MIKKLFLIIVFSLFFCANVYAGDLYGTAKLGYGQIKYQDIKWDSFKLSNEKTDDSFKAGLAIGYDWNDDGAPVRTELEYMYNENFNYSSTVTSGANNITGKFESNIQTFYANAYYDFLREEKFNPYVGGGIGFATLDSSVNFSAASTNSGVTYAVQKYSTSRTNFAWNLGFGVAYRIDDNWAADLGYRYEDVGQAKIKVAGTKIKGEGSIHSILLGLRYTF